MPPLSSVGQLTPGVARYFKKSTSCVIKDREIITNLLIFFSTMVTVVNKVKWNLLNVSIINVDLVNIYFFIILLR